MNLGACEVDDVNKGAGVTSSSLTSSSLDTAGLCLRNVTYFGLVVSSGSLSVDLVRLIMVYLGSESPSEFSFAPSPKSRYLDLSTVLYVGLNLSVVSSTGVSSSSSSLVLSLTSFEGLK